MAAQRLKMRAKADAKKAAAETTGSEANATAEVAPAIERKKTLAVMIAKEEKRITAS